MTRTALLLSCNILTQLRYHPWYGIIKNNSPNTSLWQQLQDLKLSPGISIIEKKINRINHQFFLLRFFYWIFNIEQYRTHYYILAAHHSVNLFEAFIMQNGLKSNDKKFVYSQQLSFRQGANRNKHRSLQLVNEDANEICNTAENSSAKSIFSSWNKNELDYEPVFQLGEAAKRVLSFEIDEDSSAAVAHQKNKNQTSTTSWRKVLDVKKTNSKIEHNQENQSFLGSILNNVFSVFTWPISQNILFNQQKPDTSSDCSSDSEEYHSDDDSDDSSSENEQTCANTSSALVLTKLTRSKSFADIEINLLSNQKRFAEKGFYISGNNIATLCGLFMMNFIDENQLKHLCKNHEEKKFVLLQELKAKHRNNLLSLHPDKGGTDNAALQRAKNGFYIVIDNEFPSDSQENEQLIRNRRYGYYHQLIIPDFIEANKTNHDNLKKLANDMTEFKQKISKELFAIQQSSQTHSDSTLGKYR